MQPRMDANFRFVICVLVASLAALQFGYHMAELNAPQEILTCGNLDPNVSDCIRMNVKEIGVVNGMNAVGGMIGAFIAGSLADRLGRKPLVFFNSIFFIVGSATMAMSHSVMKMSAGRFLTGMGSGSGLVLCPLYIAEISPISLRAYTGVMTGTFTCVGILLTQLLGLFFSSESQWRDIFWSAALLGVVNLSLAPLTVESPKWLAMRGANIEAFNSLDLIRNSHHTALEHEIDAWHISTEQQQPLLVDEDRKIGIHQFLTDPIYRPTLIAVIGGMVIQQFTGVNSIVFYGVEILTPIMPAQSRLINVFISLVNCLATLFAAPTLDKFGRKYMLLVSVSGVSLFAFTLSVSLMLGIQTGAGLSAILFIFSYGLALNAVPFILIGEITAANAIGASQSIATTANWICTFIVAFTFPILQSKLHDAAFLVFTAVGIASIVFIINMIPETKGRRTPKEVWDQF